MYMAEDFSFEFQESPYYYEIDRPDPNPETGLPYTMALKHGAPPRFYKQLEAYRQWRIYDRKAMLSGWDD